jgi:hypothetical protein
MQVPRIDFAGNFFFSTREWFHDARWLHDAPMVGANRLSNG